MLENQRWAAFETRRKSHVAAYLLWLLLGVVGAHRFYLQMRASGFGMLYLACVAGVTFFFSDLLGIEDTVLIVTSATMLLLGIWVLLDVFRIPGFVHAYNDRLIRWLSGDVATRRWPRRQQAVYLQRGRIPDLESKAQALIRGALRNPAGKTWTFNYKFQTFNSNANDRANVCMDR